MSYFNNGLSNAELKKEYRALAKLYHPDYHPGEEEKYHTIMCEINKEYDEYFVSIWRSEGYSNIWEYWDAKYKAASSRERVVYAMRNKKYPDRGNFYTFTSANPKYSETYYGDDTSWNGFRTGFTLVTIPTSVFNMSMYRVPTKLKLPNNEQLLTHCEPFPTISWQGEVYKSDTNFTIIEQKYGNRIMIKSYEMGKKFGIRGDFACMVANGNYHECEISTKWFGPTTVVEKINATDLLFTEYLGMSFDDFAVNYDIYDPQYMAGEHVRVKDDMYYGSVVGQYIRKGLVDILQCKTNHTMKYGKFNIVELSRHLPELNIEDINEVQDYLDQINEDYDNKVRGMIKKCKINIGI